MYAKQLKKYANWKTPHTLYLLVNIMRALLIKCMRMWATNNLLQPVPNNLTNLKLVGAENKLKLPIALHKCESDGQLVLM